MFIDSQMRLAKITLNFLFSLSFVLSFNAFNQFEAHETNSVLNLLSLNHKIDSKTNSQQNNGKLKNHPKKGKVRMIESSSFFLYVNRFVN